MELALRNSLNAIFDRHERFARSRLDAKAMDDKVARRLALFQQRRETMFRPVMEAVGSYLMSKGYEHDVLIFEADRAKPSTEQESRFCFHVVKPPRIMDAREYPGLSVVCDPFSNTVRFRTNRQWNGRAHGFASAGTMSIEEADLAVFQEQMLAFIAAVFG